MKQKFLYLTTTSLVMIWGLSFTAQAQVCATQPSCESLGFTQKAADCTEQKTLKCPFDTNKVFCGGKDCTGFTLTSCDTSIGTCELCDGKYKYIACKAGWSLSKGSCIINDCNGSSLREECAPGHCSDEPRCQSGNNYYYYCNQCAPGYTMCNPGSCHIGNSFSEACF